MSIKDLIEEFYYIDGNDQSITWYKSEDLLSRNRFDLAFKLFYLKYKNKCPELSRELYKSHIYAITNGSFKEFGNTSKNSFKLFMDEFDSIYNSIYENQFDPSISLIPITKDEGIILNGSHRVASSINLGIKVPTVNIKHETPKYDLNFFKIRGVSNLHIELSLMEYLLETKNIFVACIWPVAQKALSQVLDNIGENNILYSKTINFSPNGAQNLISILYEGHSWLGDLEDGYRGTISKYAKTFTTSGDVTFVFFEENNFNNVLNLKSSIRSSLNLGKHSIHINDTHDELIDLSRYVLNENSINFLNNFNPLNIKSKYKLLINYRNEIQLKKKCVEDFVVCGSFPLQMYGILESKDLDYLSIENIILNDSEIGSHNSYIDFFDKNIEELIYNSNNYFYYKGLKFLSLNEIKLFKENRGELKDKIFITSFLKKEKSLKNYFNKFFYRLQLIKYKTISAIIKYSKPLGLYDFLKFVYKKF